MLRQIVAAAGTVEDRQQAEAGGTSHELKATLLNAGVGS